MNHTTIEYRRNTILNSRNYLLLFLAWPFLAFTTAIVNYSRKESKWVVYLYFIYFGISLVMGGEGNDAERYALHLQENAALPFHEFFNIVGGLYSTDTSVDIVEPFVSFVVSRITSHYSILFAVYAAIFGFFYLKSINILHRKYTENPGWNPFVFMAFFVMILPVTAINGFRMWTAAWIFFFGAYHVIVNRDIKYLIIALCSALVHWSFLTANFILIIYFIAGNRRLIYTSILFLSFIIPALLGPYMEIIALKLGGGLQTRIEMYTNENYILGRREAFEQVAWFMRITDDIVLYYLISVIIALQFIYPLSKQKDIHKNILSFSLLFLAFVNFGKIIPSFGPRFQLIFYLFAVFYIFLCFLELPARKVSFLTIIGTFPMLLYSAIVFRQGSDIINSWIFVPLLGSPLFFNGVPLSDLLFG